MMDTLQKGQFFTPLFLTLIIESTYCSKEGVSVRGW